MDVFKSVEFVELSPGETTNLDSRRRRIVDTWRELDVMTPGGASREVLLVRYEVERLLESGQPGDIRRAERLTAKLEFQIRFGSD